MGDEDESRDDIAPRTPEMIIQRCSLDKYRGEENTNVQDAAQNDDISGLDLASINSSATSSLYFELKKRLSSNIESARIDTNEDDGLLDDFFLEFGR